MDPNATLILLLEAIEDGEPDDARRSLEDLLHWLSNGGFRPEFGAAIDAIKNAEKKG